MYNHRDDDQRYAPSPIGSPGHGGFNEVTQTALGDHHGDPSSSPICPSHSHSLFLRWLLVHLLQLLLQLHLSVAPWLTSGTGTQSVTQPHGEAQRIQRCRRISGGFSRGATLSGWK